MFACIAELWALADNLIYMADFPDLVYIDRIF